MTETSTETTTPAKAGSPLKVHHLRPAPGAKKAKTRVGRGEASKGKTAGRGTKGTKARYQVPAAFEGGQMPLHMRLPKLKGFKNRFRTEYQVVNLDRIAALFPQGGSIGVDDLVAAGAVRGDSLVKVLGDGEIGVAVNVTAHKFSGSAASKIAERFPDGGAIGVDDLVAKGLVRDDRLVKVLGGGDLSVAVQVTAHAFSASAKDKIAAAGGSTTEV
jgi:large subunit ribosomal protein L15